MRESGTTPASQCFTLVRLRIYAVRLLKSLVAAPERLYPDNTAGAQAIRTRIPKMPG